MTKHAKISYTKSAIRIAGYALLFASTKIAAVVLIVSEVIGIVEEIGH
jgi:hypothetical protein